MTSKSYNKRRESSSYGKRFEKLWLEKGEFDQLQSEVKSRRQNLKEEWSKNS